MNDSSLQSESPHNAPADGPAENADPRNVVALPAWLSRRGAIAVAALLFAWALIMSVGMGIMRSGLNDTTDIAVELWCEREAERRAEECPHADGSPTAHKGRQADAPAGSNTFIIIEAPTAESSSFADIQAPPSAAAYSHPDIPPVPWGWGPAAHCRLLGLPPADCVPEWVGPDMPGLQGSRWLPPDRGLLDDWLFLGP